MGNSVVDSSVPILGGDVEAEGEEGIEQGEGQTLYQNAVKSERNKLRSS